MTRLSIVIPALNEAPSMAQTLQPLQPLREQGVEVIVVDGGSTDGTPGLAATWANQVLHSPRGRARQLNAGAQAAQGDILLFLHADTQLPSHALEHILNAVDRGAVWGRFDVKIVGKPWMLKVVGALINVRSRLSGIATGDQAIYVQRRAFESVGGFPDQPLMEDVEISRRLKRLAPPHCHRLKVFTSGRRWEQRGVWRTIVLMWWLRWRYWRGADPSVLARAYR